MANASKTILRLPGSNTIDIIVLLIAGLCTPLTAQKRITSEPRPAWVDNPSPGLYVGISHKFAEEADARADALNDAKRKIIESLGGIIESEFVDRIVESSGDVPISEGFTSSKIKVISRNIIAVKPQHVFVEKWKERQGFLQSKITYRVFVAVPFSKSEHQQFVQELIKETLQVGEQQYQESQRLSQQGRIFIAIEQLRNISENVKPLTEITGLSPTQTARVKEFQEKMLNQSDRILNGIRVSGSGQDQVAKLGKPLPEPLEINVFWQSDDEKIPIPGLTVDFNLLSGEAIHTPQSHTNAEGVALCKVHKVLSAGTIKLQSHVQFPEGYNVTVPEFEFNIFSDNKILIKVHEQNMSETVEISYLENRLMEELSTTGFTIVENDILSHINDQKVSNFSPQNIMGMIKGESTDLIILGSVSAEEVNKIREGFYFAWADAVIKVFDISNQAVVGTYSRRSKNAGNSPQNAGTRAIAKVSEALIEQLFKEIGLRQ